MFEKNKETGKYYVVCDCCYEVSEEYDTLNKCKHGISEDGWKQHYNKSDSAVEHFCPECRED